MYLVTIGVNSGGFDVTISYATQPTHFLKIDIFSISQITDFGYHDPIFKTGGIGVTSF